MTDTVLVTGGTAYLAGWCIVELLRRGYDVRATIRSATHADAVRDAVATELDPGNRLSLAIADLTRDDGWPDVVAGCAYVLHVASPLGTAENPDDLIGPAVDSTLRVLRAATDGGVRRALAENDAELQGILPGLGRRNRHSTAKAQRLIGSQPRPAAETVLDCARSLLASADR